MGTTYVPADVGSGFRTSNLIGTELDLIADELANKLDRNGVAPNAMAADIDVGTHRLLNVQAGVIGTDGVNLTQVTQLASQIAATAVAAGGGVQGQTTGDPITFNFGVATGSQGTVGRTVFNLTTLFGVTTFLGLTVVIDGVVQIPGLAYTISALTIVTLTEAVNTDTNLMFIYGDLSPTPVLPNILAAAGISYDLSTYIFTTTTVSQECIRFKSPRIITWLANFSGSTGSSRVAATAQTDFNVLVNAVSKGTIRFAAAATSATFIAASPVTVAVGDIITVVGPASPDATLAGISLVLFGAVGA